MRERAVFAGIAVIAVFVAALGGCPSGECKPCGVVGGDQVVACQQGCLDEKGACKGNGVVINANVGGTCQQTNTTHGVCSDAGVCNVTHCQGGLACTDNPNQCWTGFQGCVGGGPVGSCFDRDRKPDGTACDGGTCHDGGCSP